MSKKGIEDMLNELEMFIDNCKFQPFSSTKIIVPKDEFMIMLQDLREKLPNEVERCQKVVQNKEAILAEAKEQAEQIVLSANEKMNGLLEQHELVEQAREYAEQLVQEAQGKAAEHLELAKSEADAMIEVARQESQAIQKGALEYTQDTLSQMEEWFHHTLVEGSKRYNEMLDHIEESMTMIRNNRQEVEGSIQSMSEDTERVQ